MSYFTVAYLIRLMTWGLIVALLQGPLVLLSGLAWQRVLAHASPAKRHRSLCIHFAALSLLPVLTLAILHCTIAAMGAAGMHGWSSVQSAKIIAQEQGSAELSSLLTLLWASGCALMAARLLVEVRRLRRVRHQPASATLMEAIDRLPCRWKSPSTLSVRGADVLAPQIVGLRSPLLLLPHDFEQRLPAAERETILLHEFAHVCRRDFGWNLLQRWMLALLWFQPAAWILYHRVASERERCCDDLAVRQGARATDLAKALVCLAKRRDTHIIAMAASGQSELTPRVHYLLGLRPPGAVSRGQSALALVASVGCVLALAAGRLTQFDPALAGLCNASALGWTVSINAHDSVGVFALRIRRGHVVAASVEKRLLPAEAIRQEGERVTLLGAQLQPLVRLTVQPHGAISWDARPPN